MPISDWVSWGMGAALAVSVSLPAVALDVSDKPPPVVAPKAGAPAYASVNDALRAGLDGLSTGNTGLAVSALQYAATNGNVAAQWKLGRMYSDGASTLRNDLKAFEYFAQIANKHADESPDSPLARMVSQAFVALGNYYLEGIPNSEIRRDRVRARELYHYAASYFGDPDAQYNLARMYLDPGPEKRNPGFAARWLNLAAAKGHAPAQATLGHILFTGDGLPRQGARGLMWIMIAKARADAGGQSWIGDLLAEAMARATEDERRSATELAALALRSAR